MSDLWEIAPEQQEDDVPFADPRIQEDYERALGRFLVAFNRIEGCVSDIIIEAMKRLGREMDIERALDKSFARRLDYMVDRLKELPEFPIVQNNFVRVGDVRELSKTRNSLAHGHFDQNPFSGEYEIVNRDTVAERWSPETIEPEIRKANELWDHLDYVRLYLEFDPLN